MEPRHADPDRRAQHRALILEHVAAGDVSVDEAARILGLSSRQVGRLLARYVADPRDLAHGNRGRAPANRIPADTRAQLVELARTRYAGVNHAHLVELLAEREGISVAERTLRRILDEAGVAPVRTRRPPRHRTRRDRMPREGLLLQVDGSRHDWLEGRGPWLTLVGGIDDATSRVTGATFRAAEDAAGYFATFTQTARRHGLPGAVYSDRHGIFVHEPARAPTITEQLTGRRTFTQVGRALDDLEIGWIGARSPQAKGRVERLWGTLGEPARLRAASGRGEHARGRQRRPGDLPAPPQPALQRAGCRSCACLAAPAGGHQRRVGLLLLVSPPGGQRRDARLGWRAARPPAPARRAQLGGSVGHRGGTPRRQPVGQPRRRALSVGRGTTRSCRPPCPGPLAGGRGQAGPAGQPHAARVSRGLEGHAVGWSAAAHSGPPVASMSPPVADGIAGRLADRVAGRRHERPGASSVHLDRPTRRADLVSRPSRQATRFSGPGLT
jgi:transposase